MNYNIARTKINTPSANYEQKICKTPFMIELAGSRLGGDILHQLEFLSSISKQEGHTFYMAIGPTANKRYGNTQSLCERIFSNPRTVRRHLKRVAQNLNRNPDVDPSMLAYYRVDKNNVTHWKFNRELYNKRYQEMCGELPKNKLTAHIPSPSATLSVSGIGHNDHCYKDNNINKNMCVVSDKIEAEKPHTQSLVLFIQDEGLKAHFKKQTCQNHEVIKEFKMKFGRTNADMSEMWELANEIYGKPDKPVGPQVFKKFMRNEKSANYGPNKSINDDKKPEEQRSKQQILNEMTAIYNQHKKYPELRLLTEMKEKEYEKILLSVGAIGNRDVIEHRPERGPTRLSDILSGVVNTKRLSNRELFLEAS